MIQLKDYLTPGVPFDISRFAQGNCIFAPILTWQWTREPTDEEIDNQLAAAKRAGFGTVYVLPLPKEFRPQTMETELEGYLRPHFFARIKYALERARAYGLLLWLYDEGGWPSGAACGQVVQRYPEERAKQLVMTEDGSFAVKTGKDLIPDMYSAKAASYFTEITYHAYAEALGDLAGEVQAVFTDEPAGCPNAVSDAICERFRSDYGYSLQAHPAAVAKRDSFTDEQAAVRRDYFRLLGVLFRETMRTYHTAAAAHNWLLVGHLDRDHTADSNYSKGYANTLAALKMLDVPGVDAISGQIRSDGNRMDGLYLDFYPRFASSAAAQSGTLLTLSESFAVYGNALSGDEMRYILNSQLVRGVNLFNFMLMPVSLNRWNAFGERPYFHPSVPGFFALDSLCKEIERACLFMAAGAHRTDTALFYPYEDMLCSAAHRETAALHFREAGNDLERSGTDFDLIDTDTIRLSPVSDGKLICGTAAYGRVVLPAGCTVPPDVQKKIALLHHEAQPIVGSDCPRFLYRTIQTPDGDLHICIFNEDRTPNTGAVFIRTEKSIYRLCPKTGTAHRFENGGRLNLAYGECALLLVTEKELPVCDVLPGKDIPLTAASAECSAVFRLSAEGAALEKRQTAVPLPIDGSADFPAGFCGEIAYTFAFRADAETDLMLSFETLSYFAEVFINGVRAGSVCTAPYALKINRSFMHRTNNTLTVKIANLAAAAYARFPAENFFEQKRLGPYHRPSREAEQQITGGGFSGIRLAALHAM